MHAKVYYSTVSEAIETLRKKGYVRDFNLAENCIVCDIGKYSAAEFEIDEVYRYEGITDPADEAVVYGISSNTGEKGVLVTGYGPSQDSMTDDILKKLRW